MENHARFPIMVLRIEIRPEECRELEKLLLKIHGVHEVAIDGQKQKVKIVGDVNPLKLVKYISKMGKKAELLAYDKKPKFDGTNPSQKHHNINNNAQDYSRHNHGNHHHHHHHHGSSAKDVQTEEEEELMFRPERNNGSFHREFIGEPDRRQYHHHHGGQYHSTSSNSKGFHDHDQQCFHGRSRSSKGFLHTMEGETRHHDNPLHCKCQATAAEEEMKKKQGRYDQFYGRRNYNSTTNTNQDSNCYCFPIPDNHHPDSGAAAGGNKFPQEEQKGGEGYQERSRSSHGSRTRYAEYDQPSFHETKFEDEIKEAKRDMNQFFTGVRGGRSNKYDDHFIPPGKRSSSYHHHDMPPPPDEYYADRNHPPPPPPPRVYRTRPGTHYDKFTNFFSDENPSSCTIV